LGEKVEVAVVLGRGECVGRKILVERSSDREKVRDYRG
jgi:hypothetical protein